MPQPPYVLIFEDISQDAQPLALMVEARSAVPLFDSKAKAGAFLSSADLGASLKPVEVSLPALIRALEQVRDQVEYVALNLPPAREGGMKVRMGSLEELIEALRQARQENDLFGLGRNGSA